MVSPFEIESVRTTQPRKSHSAQFESYYYACTHIHGRVGATLRIPRKKVRLHSRVSQSTDQRPYHAFLLWASNLPTPLFLAQIGSICGFTSAGLFPICDPDLGFSPSVSWTPLLVVFRFQLDWLFLFLFSFSHRLVFPS